MLCACSGSTEEYPPDDILSKEQLIPLIVDLQILESHFQRQFSRVDAYHEALDSSSVTVFDKHGISKENYTKSLQFYANDPDTLYMIYEAALDTINYRINSAPSATEMPE